MMSTKEMAEHIARLAGAELMKKASGLTTGDVSFKKHGETVTRIDREINTFIINELKAHFPDHDLVTEEADVIDGNGEAKRWYVDPIIRTYGLTMIIAMAVPTMDTHGVVMHFPASKRALMRS